MGMIGVVVSVMIIAFVAWYGYFGVSGEKLVVENVTPPVVQELSQAQETIGAAKDLVKTLERRTNDSVVEAEGEDKLITSLQPTTTVENKMTGDVAIVDHLMTSGFLSAKAGRNIDTVVLHSSYDLLGKEPYSVLGLIKEYEGYGVSAHYLIDRKGVVYRLVQDKDIAYHAGTSKMPDGRSEVNGFSIGIEMMNKENTEYTDAQYAAVNKLLASLRATYPIRFVVGHNDIAPGRKTDPWNFDWKRLE